MEQEPIASGPRDTDAMTSGPDHARVLAAMAQLSPEQRRVVELAYFDGLSCSEISTTINIPIGTVKSRVASAMTKLRSALLPRDMEEPFQIQPATDTSLQNPPPNPPMTASRNRQP